MENKKDRIFTDPTSRKHFAFDQNVADVFDDMLERSVPFYFEIQHMILDLAETFVVQGSNVYDLGCSTGTTLSMLIKHLGKRNLSYVGIDFSKPILKKAYEKLDVFSKKAKVSLICKDLNEEIKIENASVTILNLVLQFVKPQNRIKLLRNIYENTLLGGCLILVEKVLCEDSSIDSLYSDLYHRFKKRKGYSEVEIANKDEALKDVLIPYMTSQNVSLLKEAGFDVVDVFFRWHNFVGILAIKK